MLNRHMQTFIERSNEMFRVALFGSFVSFLETEDSALIPWILPWMSFTMRIMNTQLHLDVQQCNNDLMQ